MASQQNQQNHIFTFTSFCSNMIWLYNLWNCSKSRWSFFDPTFWKSREQNQWQRKQLIAAIANNEKDPTDGNDGASTDDLYLKFFFECSRAGGFIVEQGKQSLQLLQCDAELKRQDTLLISDFHWIFLEKYEDFFHFHRKLKQQTRTTCGSTSDILI